jgi:hypothetical protein
MIWSIQLDALAGHASLLGIDMLAGHVGGQRFIAAPTLDYHDLTCGRTLSSSAERYFPLRSAADAGSASGISIPTDRGKVRVRVRSTNPGVRVQPGAPDLLLTMPRERRPRCPN